MKFQFHYFLLVCKKKILFEGFIFELTLLLPQDAVMPEEPTEQSQHSNWSYHSNLELSRPSWLDGTNLHPRISIGTFMAHRTEALGSLDGDGDEMRVRPLPSQTTADSSIVSFLLLKKIPAYQNQFIFVILHYFHLAYKWSIEKCFCRS